MRHETCVATIGLASEDGMNGRTVWVTGATLILAMIAGPGMAIDTPVASLAEPATTTLLGLTVPATLILFGLGVVGAFAARKLLVKRK